MVTSLTKLRHDEDHLFFGYYLSAAALETRKRRRETLASLAAPP